MKIAGSGHRPNKLGGYQIPNPKYNQISWKLKEILEELKPECCMSGMALGYDQILANVCSYLSIPWLAAVPFIDQEKAWPKEAQNTYHRLLNKLKRLLS